MYAQLAPILPMAVAHANVLAGGVPEKARDVGSGDREPPIAPLQVRYSGSRRVFKVQRERSVPANSSGGGEFI